MTKSKPKHTELPYSVTPPDGVNTRFTIYSEAEGKGYDVAVTKPQGSYEREKANAAFLVRAANNHYKLVESLNDLISAYDHDCKEARCEKLPGSCIWADASAAIREAEKED